jgi:hypothetical protein
MPTIRALLASLILAVSLGGCIVYSYDDDGYHHHHHDYWH